MRRRIENGAKELWFFLQSELKKLRNLEGSEFQRHIDELLSDVGNHERYLMIISSECFLVLKIAKMICFLGIHI